MDEKQSHHLRITIIAAVGLMTALATITGVILFLPSSALQQPDQVFAIDAASTLSFLSGTTASKLSEAEYVIRDPKEALAMLRKYLKRTDPITAEGIDGILERRLLDLTGKTGIVKAIEDLSAKGLSLRVLPQDDRMLFTLTGKGASTALVEQWFAATKTTRTSGIVRVLPLPDGNVRRDIVPTPLLEVQENGWKILEGSASGQLIVAVNKNQFIVGNDRALLQRSLTQNNPKNRAHVSIQETDTGMVLRLRTIR